MDKDRRYFVDTGAWVAFYNDGDEWHRMIKKIFQELATRKAILITSEEILLETMTLLRTRIGYSVEKVQEIIARIRASSTVISTKKSDNLKAQEIMLSRPNLTLSGIDCHSFAIMERLGIRKAVSTDGDYHRYGGFIEVRPNMDERRKTLRK